jgi:hypothetical protein
VVLRAAVASPVTAEVEEAAVLEQVISTALHHPRLMVVAEVMGATWDQALMDSQAIPVAMEAMAR